MSAPFTPVPQVSLALMAALVLGLTLLAAHALAGSLPARGAVKPILFGTPSHVAGAKAVAMKPILF